MAVWHRIRVYAPGNGRMTGQVAGLALAVLICGAASLRAHDFWIEPSTFHPEPGAVVGIGLRVGQSFVGDSVGRTAEMIDRFYVRQGGRDTPVNGIDGADPAGFLRVATPGLLVVGYFSNPSAVEAAAWEYIQKIDAMGGIVKAVEEGYPQREIARSAFEFQREVDSGRRPIVGGSAACLGRNGGGREEHPERRPAAVAILNIGGSHQHVQHEAQRVDQDVTLLPLDQLAGIKAVWVDGRAPFSALFTLWLSITQAVGLASRSACSRHFM